MRSIPRLSPQYIHPYTFINHQLGLYCLDRENFSIDFGEMYQELESLYTSGYISKELFSYFQDVGWNTEMKFRFFAPSKHFFIQQVNNVLKFVEFVYTSDVFTNVFPIYIIKQKDMEGIL